MQAYKNNENAKSSQISKNKQCASVNENAGTSILVNHCTYIGPKYFIQSKYKSTDPIYTVFVIGFKFFSPVDIEQVKFQ